MLVIDCHDHIYPKRIAPRAVKTVGKYYDVPMEGSGVTDELIELAKNTPIRKFIVNVVAGDPRSVTKLNDFAAAECQAHPELIGLGTLHPDMEEPEQEIERMLSMGMHGIKLHPDTQNFDMDCDNAMRIYEYVQGRVPILMHCGDYRSDRSHPRRLVRILEKFPQLTVVAAHLGGWSIFEEAVPYMTQLNCPMDISSVMPFIGTERCAELIQHYGADRILFGSDFPMWDPVREYNNVLSMSLSQEDKDKILWKNAAEIFRIEVDSEEVAAQGQPG